MSAKFHHQGYRFQYPSNWKVELENHDHDLSWTATVQSPDLAFMSLTRFPSPSGSETILAEAYESFLQEYPTLESSEITRSIAGTTATGYHLDFLTVDTSVEVTLLLIAVLQGYLLLTLQSTSYDPPIHQQVFHAILATLVIPQRPDSVPGN